MNKKQNIKPNLSGIASGLFLALIVYLITQGIECPSKVKDERISMLNDELKQCKEMQSDELWVRYQEQGAKFKKQTDVLLETAKQKERVEKDKNWNTMWSYSKQPFVATNPETGEIIYYLPGKITPDSFLVAARESVEAPTAAEMTLNDIAYRYSDGLNLVNRGDSIYVRLLKSSGAPEDSIKELAQKVIEQRAARTKWRKGL